MTMLEFAKLHGLGNDFLVARRPEGDGRPLAAMSRAICERHRGVGADGILVYQPTVGDAEFICSGTYLDREKE